MTDDRPTSRVGTSLGLLVLATVCVTVGASLVGVTRDIVSNGGNGVSDVGALFRDPALRAAFARTLAVAVSAGLVTLTLAVPAALVIARGLGRDSGPTLLMFALPLAIPPFLTARTIGPLVQSLASAPAIRDLTAGVLEGPAFTLALIYVVHFLPLVTAATVLSLRRADPDLEIAARSLGAGSWTIWTRTLMPLALPGVLLGTSLLAIRVIDDAASPTVLGMQDMLAPMIWRLNAAGQVQDAAPAVLLLAGLSALVVAIGWSSLRPRARGIADLRAGRTRAVRHARWRTPAIAVATAGLAIALLQPLSLAGLVIDDLAAQAQGSVAQVASMPFVPVFEPLVTTLSHAAMAGIALLLLSGLLAPAVRAASAGGNVARALVTALFALPAVALAAAWVEPLHATFPASLADVSAWGALVTLAALKGLPLGVFLVATRSFPPSPDLRAADRTLSTGRRGMQPWRAAGLRSGLCLALFLAGAATLLVEVSAALIVLHNPHDHLGVLAWDGHLPPSDWRTAAILLLMLTLGAAALAIKAWRVSPIRAHVQARVAGREERT
ncbi:MAG: ABC transporter permease subunit [Gammaproteobacteria bacterium]|nr:ABC transporter permease subunit [Gammaproteobacteria bacterium]